MAALQAIFGKCLGHRIWRQARLKTPTPRAPIDRVADSEIAAGMVAYLSRRAAEALLQFGGQATSLTVTISYVDGEARQSRVRLTSPTNQGDDIAKAAIAILHKLPPRDAAPASIRLAMSSVECDPFAPS
jgi:hypothetical protein